MANTTRTIAQTLPSPIEGAPTAIPISGGSVPALPASPVGAANLSAAANLTAASHQPAPSMLQVLTSARQGLCARVRVSPVCQLVSNMRKPLSVATGGLIAAEKIPHQDEQAQPGPEGTAAQLKAVNLQAPKRRAAVRELQGMDVRYHPEAESILIAALRVDPSECVRFEAANTIATLPVCTEKIAKALRTCVDSSERDGNPAELSLRVRSQAAAAIANCECCLPESTNDIHLRPEYPISRNVDASPSQSTGVPQRVPPIQPKSDSQTSQPAEVQVVGWFQPVDQRDIRPADPDAATELRPITNSRPRNLFEAFKSARERP